jgi:hypothetical protein
MLSPFANIKILNKSTITIPTHTTSYTVDELGTEIPVNTNITAKIYIKKLKETVDPQTGKPIINLSGYPVCLYFIDTDPATIKFNSYDDKLEVVTYDVDETTVISKGKFTLKEVAPSQFSIVNDILGYRWYGFLQVTPI